MVEKNQSESIVDVTEENFSQQVVETSRETPVLVDFWASWCAPCRMLGPVLERLADEFQGAFVLARVNTEETPTLAAQLRIQSIPYVVLFKDGQPVDQFVGALPEGEVRKFLRKHCQTPADEKVQAAELKLNLGDLEGAAKDLHDILNTEPSHPGALLQMASLAWKRRNLEEVDEYLRKIDPLSEQANQAENLQAIIRFRQLCDQFEGIETCRRRVRESPQDLKSQFQLGCCLAAEEEYKEALETFLSIVAKDRSFMDEEPRKAMLDVFRIIGNRSPLAEEYRTRLARTIF